MKGSPLAPHDGYQQEAIEILNRDRIRYGHFDVLKDSEARELLKQFTKCHSYPQMYVQGRFIGGGLSLMRELSEEGRLVHLVPQSEIMAPGILKVEKLLNKDLFMVFMSGSPEHPGCPQALKMLLVLRKYPHII